AVLRGALDDPVVDIGDVAHIRDFVSASTQMAQQHVEHDQHPPVADVDVVVDGHAADVHPDLAGDNRLQLLLLTGERVVNTNHGRGHLGANLASRSWAAPGGMAFNSGASSGPCASPLIATRSGMYRSAPFLPVAARTAPAMACRSLPLCAAACEAAEKN